jgi:hypothetical protein
MPSQHRKHRGYESQRIVADYLREHGWPFAEPVGAGRPGSDITGTVTLSVEVKARAGFDPAAALRQAEDAAAGRLPFVVLRLNGQGPASVEEWPVVIRLGRFVEVLREAGYGDG